MLILVRYGEIGLKSAQVQTGFVTRLRRNLQKKLDATNIDGHILEREDRIFAEVSGDDAADAALALSRVPGVVSVSPVVESTLSMDTMIETGTSVFADEYRDRDDNPSFAVNARRAGEHDYTSKDIENKLGQAIVDEYNTPVNLDTPDITVYVEARYKNAYIYTRRINGIGGLPVNAETPVAVLMTDRAATVAAYLLMKRGCTVYPVYTGHDPDNLEQDMAILRQFDPHVKLTVMKGTDDMKALEQVCDLYDINAIAFSHTADEIDSVERPAIDAAILYPVCGMHHAEVLDTYGSITYTPV